MKLTGYTRDGTDGASAINDFAASNCLVLTDVLSDSAGEYSAFRALQTRVKLGVTDAVVVPSYLSLGEDKYIRLENELFLRRNGVRLIAVRKAFVDRRRELIIAAKRFSSFVTEWDVSYGLDLPELPNPIKPNSNIPFGYSFVNGRAVIDAEDGETVRRIFQCYIDGMRIGEIVKLLGGTVSKRGLKFGNMTVKTVLKNDRYLGRMSKKGVKLPPMIRYDTWLKVNERLEREYPPAPPAELIVKNVFSDDSLAIRAGCRCAVKDGCISIEEAEDRLFEMIAYLASEDNARALYEDHAVKELSETEKVLPRAIGAYNRVLLEIGKELSKVKAGDYSDETQNRLEHLSDIRAVYGMRRRRVKSEIELFSIGREDVEIFFERARRIKNLSREEQSLIANAFVRAVRIRNGSVEALFISPASGKSIKRILL